MMVMLLLIKPHFAKAKLYSVDTINCEKLDLTDNFLSLP